MDQEPLHIRPHQKLKGRNYGVRLRGKARDVYVPPEFFSLLKSEDPKLLISRESMLLESLLIKEITEDDEENPFRDER